MYIYICIYIYVTYLVAFVGNLEEVTAEVFAAAGSPKISRRSSKALHPQLLIAGNPQSSTQPSTLKPLGFEEFRV